MAYRYYHMCRDNIGRAVTVRTYDDRVYTGIIDRVTPTHLYLSPMGNYIADNNNEVSLTTANAESTKEKGEEIQFFFPFFLPFAAIAALTFAVPFFGFRRRFFRRRFFRRRF